MHTILFFIFINISILFSKESSDFMYPESSTFPFQIKSSGSPMINLGLIQLDNKFRLLSGFKLQPTKNLFIGTIISPYKSNNELSIYYQFMLGFYSNNISKFLPDNFQIGIHRNRFGSQGDKRWFNFSISDNYNFKNINIQYCWNNLFNKNWGYNNLIFAIDYKINNIIFIKPGISIFSLSKFDFYPFIFMSFKI